MKSRNARFLLISPDKTTNLVVKHYLNNQKIPTKDYIAPNKKQREEIDEIIGSDEQWSFIIIPSEKHGMVQLKLAEKIREKKRFCCVWTNPESVLTNFYITQLFSQRNAYLFEDLYSLCLAVKLSVHWNFDAFEKTVFKGPTCDITNRIRNSLNRAEIPLTPKLDKHLPMIEVNRTGSVSITFPTKSSFVVEEPLKLALVLKQFMEPRQSIALPPTIVDEEKVSLIARPPKRLLSETTSKRLICSYGMNIPNEQLCNSATKASNFLAATKGKVVLKLVRPEFEQKKEHQAVIMNLSTTAEVRRAYQSLKNIGEQLSPPKPLGILVSEQIDTKVKIWLKLKIHPQFGPLIIGGSGEFSKGSENFILTSPVLYPEAVKGLKETTITCTESQQKELAIAIVKFSNMVEALKNRIKRAEIHPLVAPSSGPALALDALVAIAD